MLHFIDLKLSFLVGFFAVISFSQVDIIMKVLVFAVTIGYTIDRWIHLQKEKKDRKNRNRSKDNDK